jgi:hypothetical protein
LYHIARLMSLILFLTGCNLGTTNQPDLTPSTANQNVPTMMPVPAQNTAVPTSTPSSPETNLISEAWQSINTGLDQRTYTSGGILSEILALRIDPTRYTFRVHYRPQAPLLLDDWRTELPNALAIINANFFNPQNTIEGMLIADSIPHGRAYTQRGGMFALQNDVPVLRVNWLEPYQGETNITQAVQAFPMLVIDGVQSYTDTRQRRPSRRSIVAMSSNGYIYLMATPALGMGLYDLSAYLPTTDMQIWRAPQLRWRG